MAIKHSGNDNGNGNAMCLWLKKRRAPRFKSFATVKSGVRDRRVK